MRLKYFLGGSVLTLAYIALQSFSAIAFIDVAPKDSTVAFTLFEAHRINEKAEIHWISKPCNEYIIQRSLDGQNWFDVLKVNGGSSNVQSFEYFDVDISAPSSKVYYRIERATDEGIVEYSKTIAIPATKDLISLNEIKTIKTLDGHITKGTLISLPFDQVEPKDMVLVLRHASGEEFYAKVKYTGIDNAYIVKDISSQLPSGSYIVTGSSQREIYGSQWNIEDTD